MSSVRLMMLLLPMVWGALSQRAAGAEAETFQSAEWLLKKATLVHGNRMHHVLLRALRQMRDPGLRPLFSELVQKHHPDLRIHGVLGLGEIGPDRRIDLSLVAEMKDPALQARAVSAAMDSDLLSMEQAGQLIGWPGLNPSVKVIVASKLVEAGQTEALEPAAFLAEAVASEKAALKGMAALLKLQLGDGEALEHLRGLDRSEGEDRDRVRLMILQAADRHGFAAVAPWAGQVAAEEAIDRRLGFLALHVAMRFGDAQATEVWRQRFESTTDQADRIRLATLALDLAGEVDPALFERLTEDDDELIRQMGVVGLAIGGGEAAREPVRALLRINNLLTNNWALRYALRQPIDRARPILLAIIEASGGEANPQRLRAQRLENCVLAAEMLAEQAAEAEALFKDLFGTMPTLTQEAMLMGLIRADAESRPHRLIEGVTSWPSDTAESLALLLRAKHGQPLDEPQLQRLRLIVRGGAGLQEPLRIQAAWVYLKLTDQDEFALAGVLRK